MSGFNLAQFRDIMYVVGDAHFQGLVKKYVSQFVFLCKEVFSFQICKDQMFSEALQHKLKRLRGALCLPPPTLSLGGGGAAQRYVRLTGYLSSLRGAPPLPRTPAGSFISTPSFVSTL